jgi:hypothetical protein
MVSKNIGNEFFKSLENEIHKIGKKISKLENILNGKKEMESLMISKYNELKKNMEK